MNHLTCIVSLLLLGVHHSRGDVAAPATADHSESLHCTDKGTALIANSWLQVKSSVQVRTFPESSWLQLSSWRRRLGNAARNFRRDDSTITWVVSISVLLILTGVVVCYTSQGVVGEVVRTGIERWDVDAIGVDVMVGSADVSLMQGLIQLGSITVCNPPHYSSPNLLTANTILIQVDVPHLIGSCGDLDDLHVKKVNVTGIQVNHETRGFGSGFTSNAKEVYDFICENWPDVLESAVERSPAMARGLHLGELHLENLRVQHRSNSLSKVGMPDVNLKVPNVSYDDFVNEFGKRRTERIVRAVVKRVMKIVLSHIANDVTKAQREKVCGC